MVTTLNKPLIIRAAKFATFSSVMYATIQISIFLGVEERSWFQQWWEIIVGGSFGLIAGAVFFVTVGAIGWVSGPFYGAIGVLGLASGGALGGLGLGSIANILRQPARYNISLATVFATLVVGYFMAKWAARTVERWLVERNKRVAKS